MKHPYLPTSGNYAELFKELDISNIDELFKDIPESIRFKKTINVPGPLNEMEILQKIKTIIEKDRSINDIPTFLGGGVWPHYIPAIIDEITSRGEFLTSYTPYQPEISQGLLQALFEYQSVICELFDMDVANNSMYDWATSLGEAARMACRITHRNKIIIPKYIHPERKNILQTMTDPINVRIEEVTQNIDNGGILLNELEKNSEDAAGVYIEIPSYLGFLEQQLDEISELVHSKKALIIMGVDPTILGLIKPPGAFNADIAIGEGQPFGLGMNFGGPLLGIFTCKKEYVRQMPGRIIGLTKTLSGKRSFCMTLQTREQHIRREKATSNICTNNALCSIANAIYLSLLGPRGIKKISEILITKSSYAIKRLEKIPSLKVPYFKAPHFKEFIVNFDKTHFSTSQICQRLLEEGIQGGVDLKSEFPELGESMLLCITEIHQKSNIDFLADTLEKIL